MKSVKLSCMIAITFVALVIPAVAEIVYTPVNVTIYEDGDYRIDLTGDKKTDFTVRNISSHTACRVGGIYYDRVFLNHAKGNMAVGDNGGPAALAAGVGVGSNQNFSAATPMAGSRNGHDEGFGDCAPGVSYWGYWYGVTNGYLGLEFQIDGQTHYGWAELSFGGGYPPALTTTLTGFAYETVANQSILTGQTSGPEAVLAKPAQNRKNNRYTVKNLGTLGGTSSVAEGINNIGWATGAANLAGDESEHAVLWAYGQRIDLGTLGGPNSAVNWPVNDDRGEVAGVAETPNADPFQEDFCGFNSYGYPGNYLCLGFVWQNSTITPLPTLGGNNSFATGVNNRGQVVGLAENGTQDPNCIPPQVLDWEAVIWGPKRGEMQELPPLSGDSVSGGLAINDSGQVVGGSGVCMTPSPTAHAVLWQHGSPTDLGNLGGALNNLAIAINNQGEVVGISDLPGDATGHAFLWTKNNGMQDLGTLPGDFSSFTQSINNKGQVVGESCDVDNNCRAFLWENGVMTDLNTLAPAGSPLYLVAGFDINDRGEIVGQAYDQNTGDTPAFLAITNCDEDNSEANLSAAPKIILPEKVREQLWQRKGFGRLDSGTIRQQ